MWFLGASLLTAAVLGAWLFRRRADLRAITGGRRVAVFALYALASVTMGGFIDIFVLNSPEARASQADARHVAYAGRGGLKAIFTSEKAYFQEKDAYAPDFATMGFDGRELAPYSFEFGRDVLLAPGVTARPSELCDLTGTWPDGTPLSTGLRGEGAQAAFAALAALVQPNGETICWSIASFPRDDAKSEWRTGAPAGEPFPENARVRR